MKGALRLPVAPRPNRDELLSSWMTRVASRYGLDASALTAFLAGQGRAFRQIDDIAPDPFHLRLWARASRVDLGRLNRLSLTSRYPDRLSTWLLERTRVPVCFGCFDADHAIGRDCYMRADWKLAEHVACPTHGEMLHDRCPACRGHLRISCQIRNGLQRPFCSRCDVRLTVRVGEAAGLASAEFTAGVLDLQRQAQKIVIADDGRLARLEYAIRTLWAPLDRVDAARPVLALWFDQPGWNCPSEARAAVSSQAPLQHLSVRWRALTLVMLHDLFGEGLGSDADMPEAAHRLFRRAAPIQPQRQMSAIGKGKLSPDGATGRVHRLSMSPVHRLSGNFLDERGKFGPVHP